jgi:hypothetical protein
VHGQGLINFFTVYVAISRATDLEKVALLSPIRQDHFINKKFMAENIKINEFYSNLNFKK